MRLQAREKELAVIRAEKSKLHTTVKDLELKSKAARREAEVSNAALRMAQRAKEWASSQFRCLSKAIRFDWHSVLTKTSHSAGAESEWQGLQGTLPSSDQSRSVAREPCAVLQADSP